MKRFKTSWQEQGFSPSYRSSISQYDNDDKTEKSYKIRPIIKYLNKVFAESLSNSQFQSVDEHMCKFKATSSMKKYVKNKPIKWVFKYWNRCDSETGYVYQLELYQWQKEKRKLNLGSSVVLDLHAKSWKIPIVTCFSIIFLTVPPWFKSCMIMDCMASIQLVPIELTCRRWKRTKKWSEEITNANFTTT